jgi:hypothetical protein
MAPATTISSKVKPLQVFWFPDDRILKSLPRDWPADINEIVTQGRGFVQHWPVGAGCLIP